jgi:hypothetical protein
MNTTRRLALSLTALAFVLPTAARAATVTINPGDNVQAKLDGAADGDTVHFKPGTYTGTFTAAKNTLTVEGEGGVFLVSPSGATAATLTYTGSNAKLTDITVLSTVADAVVLGKDGSTIQRAEIVATKSGQSAVSVVGAGLDAARTITVDSSVLTGPKAFSASYAAPGIGVSTITAAFRHVTAIGNVVADASAGVGLGGGITETFLDSIIRGKQVPAAGAPTTATITADPARNSVAEAATDVAALFVKPAGFDFHLRADATAVLDKGQVTAGESEKDLDGDPRTNGPASDYGADEFVNRAPTAALAAPGAKVRQNVPATFDASKSADPEGASGGGIANYHWDFGDGKTADTTTPTTTHAFPERKSYNVTVTVTDRQGAASAASAPVAVDVLDGTPPEVSVSQPLTKQRINLYKPRTKKRAKVTFFGKASDDTQLAKVYLALRAVAVKNGRCKWFDGKSKLVTGECGNPPVLATALTGTTWRYALPRKARLPKGPYLLAAIAVDASGLPSEYKQIAFRLR